MKSCTLDNIRYPQSKLIYIIYIYIYYKLLGTWDDDN